MENRNKMYRRLFFDSYIQNNEIEGEEVGQEEKNVLNELDDDEVYENLKEILENLLQFKREAKTKLEELDKTRNINLELAKKVEFLRMKVVECNLKIADFENQAEGKKKMKAISEEITGKITGNIFQCPSKDLKRESMKPGTIKSVRVELVGKNKRFSENSPITNSKNTIYQSIDSPKKTVDKHLRSNSDILMKMHSFK